MTSRKHHRPLHLDVHLIQSFPYSNLNRDRQGAPKTSLYGGVARARLSSQNTKRPTRLEVEKATGIRAVRTRGVPRAVAERLRGRGWDEKLALTAGQMLILAASVKGLGIADTEGTNALLFLPESALDELADLADAHHGEIADAASAMAAEEAAKVKKSTRKKAGTDDDVEPTADDEEEQPAVGEDSLMAKYAKKALSKQKDAVLKVLRTRNASVAAFGRMLANDPDSTVDGAIHVAHGLTTHAARTQLDFFSAVDDLQEESRNEKGAGHMGDHRFTTGTFYRYASINYTELCGHLEGDTDTARAITAEFVRAFITAVLPAKGRGTAPYTVPHLVYAAVRTDRPISLAGAFEQPVPDGRDGYLSPSLARLNDHAAAHHRFLGTDDLADHAHTGLAEGDFPALGEHVGGMNAFVERLAAGLSWERV